MIFGQFREGYLRDTIIQVVYPNGDIYCGPHKHGVKTGKNGQYRYIKDSIVYRGEWQDNLKHGKGELIYSKENNSKLTGVFHEDELLHGEFRDEIGNIFRTKKHPDELKLKPYETAELSGKFIRGRLHGYGQVEYQGGDQYIGMFKDGKRSGAGSMIFNQKTEFISQKAEFKGQWKFNKRNGQGTMVWPDGSSFTGEWLNDCRVKGKLTMTDDNVYEGQFRDDKLHGVGQITYKRDQLVFKGIFKYGFASKLGVLTNLVDNSVYIGEIEDLKKNGVGILIDKDNLGRSFQGEFQDDMAYGNGRLIFQNGDVYTGEVEKMLRQGAGKMEFKESGKKFEGLFKSDMMEGIGYYFQPDGKVYCGQFRQDKEEGAGETLDKSEVDIQFKRVDLKNIQIILDKIYKQCQQLKQLGLNYEMLPQKGPKIVF